MVERETLGVKKMKQRQPPIYWRRNDDDDETKLGDDGQKLWRMWIIRMQTVKMVRKSDGQDWSDVDCKASPSVLRLTVKAHHQFRD